VYETGKIFYTLILRFTGSPANRMENKMLELGWFLRKGTSQAAKISTWAKVPFVDLL